MKTYDCWDKIPKTDEQAMLSLDVVLKEGETPEEAAKSLAKENPVSWTIGESGNGWPQIDFMGRCRDLFIVRHRYSTQGNSGRKKGSKNVNKAEALHNRWLKFDVPDDEKAVRADEIGWRCEKGLCIFDDDGYFMVVDGGPGPSPETGERHDAIYHLEAHDGTEWHGPLEINTILSCMDEVQYMVPRWTEGKDESK